MKKTLPLAALALAILTLPTQSQAAPPARRHILMDAGWRFAPDVPAPIRDSVPLTAWRWRVGQADEAARMTAVGLDTATPGWKDAATGEDVFGGRVGLAWFHATLPASAAIDQARHRLLRFGGVDDNATVYLNGMKLIHHEGWNDSFDVPLDAAWKSGGPNILTVLVENTAGGGGITGPATLGVSADPSGGDPASPAFRDAAWRTVHLPHDYVIEGTFTPKGDPSHGSLIPTPAWYRKTFTLPASDKGKALWLDFDGVYRDATVTLNGVTLGTHPCGYTPFRFDISQAAHYGGPNVLAVHVNAQHEEGWWYEGGGIYRHVWLTVADPIHIAPWGTFVSTKMPEPTPGQPLAPATVTVRTTVVNQSPQSQKPFVGFIVTGPNGASLARLLPVPRPLLPGASLTMSQTFEIRNPSLWSIENPQMYRAEVAILNGAPQDDGPSRSVGLATSFRVAHLIDATDTPFGIRTIRFDAERGFFLNGRPVKIKGTCNHQDFAGVGVAMPDSLLYWRVKKLKAMGSNAYRMSHNPPTSELLDACDRLGMLVMDENRHLGDTEDGKASQNTPYADLHEVQSMVLRDRNHPSVIMWSMCNEEGIQGTAHGRDIFAAMKRTVDAADGTRPVTCAMNGGYDSADGITSVEDLQGINYNPGAYDGFHRAHPAMPLYGSETASEVATRGIYGPDNFKIDGIPYLGDQAKGYISAYDLHAPGWAQTAEAAWQPIADRPYVAGGYVWTGFDYKGEPTPFGWPDVNSNFGIMDECGFPKDSYYYYQSVWGDKPIVHLLPHWNWAGKEGRPITVWAYSNAARVALSLNGKSLGTKDMPRNGHLEWSVPYAPGTLTATGYDSAGKVMATDKVETTGAPAALRLSTDRATLQTDGEDLTMVEVDVVDAHGRVVPTADTLVSFTVKGAGRIRGVGNGDPSSHEPDQAGQRRAFGGKCLVIVGAGDRPGGITLTANAPGLQPAALPLEAR